MSDFQQVEHLTLDALRSELRNFAVETLHLELSQQSRGIHEDLEKMFSDLQQTLSEQLLHGRTQQALKGLQGGATATRSQLQATAAEEDDDATVVVSVESTCTPAPLPAIASPPSPPSAASPASPNACSPASPNAWASLPGAISPEGHENGGSEALKHSEALRGSEDFANGCLPLPPIVRESRKGSKQSVASKQSVGSSMGTRGSPISPAKAKEARRGSVGSSGKPTFAAKPDSGKMRTRLIALCNHVWFDYATAVLILLNGILVGIQTQYMVSHHLENTPRSFEVFEYAFCVAFTTELGLRLFAYRFDFFTMGGRGWNIFDFVIVSLQLLEIFLGFLASGRGINFNVLRILRLLRIIRLARALRLIGELRTLVSTIAHSMNALLWTAVLLFMIVYVLGVCLTQAVHQERIRWRKNDQDVPQQLEKYWGTLIGSIFSLFESITGGVDWDEIVRPLIDHIGPEWGLLFCGYILFTVLAMLNVVTGVFIDSVMTNASLAKDQRTIAHVQDLFKKLDIDKSGAITWEVFESQLAQKEMQDFFKTIDVDIEKASSLFELLDLDDSGSVDLSEFMDGCLRIWSPAKGLDQRMILRDVNRIASRLPPSPCKGEGGEGEKGHDFFLNEPPFERQRSPAHADFRLAHTLGTRGNYEDAEQ